MPIELTGVQFWSEIILLISNRACAGHSFNFEITRMLSDLVIYRQQFLPSDWLRTCQSQISAISSVQKSEVECKTVKLKMIESCDKIELRQRKWRTKVR